VELSAKKRSFLVVHERGAGSYRHKCVRCT